MRRSSLLLLLVMLGSAGLAGCNYDPELRLFRQVAPKPTDVVLQTPGAESQALEGGGGGSSVEQALNHCDEDTLRCHSENIATGLNALTYMLLTIVDRVVQAPPSQRATGRRVWGPHFDRASGNTFRFEMTRDDDDTFSWCLHVGAGDLSSAGGMRQLSCDVGQAENGMFRLLSGNLLPGDVEGEVARSGNGTMLLEALNLRELEDDPELLGTFAFAYDNTDGQAVEIEISDVPEEPPTFFGTSARYQYTRTPAGDGTFAFAARANFAGGDGSQREDFRITSRWQTDEAGRADATISGGDLEQGVTYDATHCWDNALVTTYSGNTFDPGGAVGDEDDCVFLVALGS